MSDEEEKTLNEDSQISGPFVVKGMRLRIKDFPISMGDDGQLTLGPLTLYTSLDMSSYWLKIAYNHLLAAEQAHEALLNAKQRDHSEDIGGALEQEFFSGMQAMMACGIAIDAFYASVKEYAAIPPETTRAWHDNGTARYKQVSEVFRLAFRLDNVNAQELRKVIKRIYYFRDRAVHPSSKASALALHPQLNKMTNWWYAAFCFQNAKMAVSFALQIVCRLAGSPREEDYISLDLMNYCKTSFTRVVPLLDMWGKQYGPLIKQTV